MSTLLVDRIAQHIRTVDADNMLSPSALGIEIVAFLRGQGLTLDETDDLRRMPLSELTRVAEAMDVISRRAVALVNREEMPDE